MPEAISLYDLLHSRQRVPMTQCLIAVNTVVFGMMLLAGAGLWHGNNAIQLAWGANFGPATQDGQWWRLGSALFLHFGLLHLCMNMWALWDAGQLVERLFGHGRFAVIYFGGGMVGNLLSLVAQGNEAISGGASGAIFATYGALIVFLWREKAAIEGEEFRWLFRSALIFTGASMGLGWIIPGVDNSAHAGGLLGGILLGQLLGRPLRPADAWPKLARQGALFFLLAGIGVLFAHLPAPKYSWRAEIAAREEIQAFLARESSIRQHWQEITRPETLGDESPFELARRIELEIAQSYEDSIEQLSQLELSPASPSAAQVESLLAYSAKRRDSSQNLASQLRRHGLTAAPGARQPFSRLPSPSSSPTP
ncbi:MAG: rhomboid family intramembrane serine protease [Rhodocyclales bacterium GT-UBC]|nr:MAG: rhomboid family intramembrane serine protease [Rhodocyclales bacterium GT-UBC]